MTRTEISEAVHADSISSKIVAGAKVYTVRRSFFYSHGGTSTKFAASVLAAIPNAEIIDHGTVMKPFSGGASIANSTHWWVKFVIVVAPVAVDLVDTRSC